ncbi:hypothetical protein J7X21_003632 [Vibrio parahaemolyticus]|nr:hypothetical protein [Vibrio parahaemolyticus]EHH2464412.1 hypothetical protein [Vibrio parahaemolyticus]HCE4711326.1 restriction endonuclease subunit S [Vibrio parahaemolyticus]HCG9791290.1 restriction endonuclease subunit S [Vibrio parahaemolyticus]HCH4921047.1 restriction endonuclease subunit S [Vibrio parahaemolyticus]
MSELPKGWVNQNLVEITTKIGSGSTPRGGQDAYKAEGIPLIRSMNVRFSGLDAKGLAFIDNEQADKLNAVTISDKDVLLNITGASIGRVSVARDWAVGGRVNQHVCIIRPVFVDPLSDYLNYYLMTPKMQDYINSNESGATRQALTKAKVESLSVPIAPLPEQKRIVEKLDEVLAQVDAIKARLDGIPDLLKRFRQSVLASAVSGKLIGNTLDFQSTLVGDPWSHKVTAPKHWKLYEFKKAVKIIGGSQPPKSEFRDEDGEGLIRLIQIRDYKSDKFRVYIPIEKAKRFCSGQDIMIGRYGPPIFQILRGLEGAYNVALMKAEPLIGELNKEYLYRFLQNPKLFNYIDAGSDRTAGQAGVNKKFLESYPIFVPPLSEQQEIVRLVDQYFAFADTIEVQVKKAQARVDNLTQSILAKAFRGELVPQNDDDEPADKLLERIAQARKEAEALAKAAKKVEAAKKRAANKARV